jgi:hypothetical protein
MNTTLISFNVVPFPIPNFKVDLMKTINTIIIMTRRCILVLQILFVHRTQTRIRIRQQTRSLHRR